MKRRMVILVSVALMATVGGVGCGSKTTTTPIVPPQIDTAPPAAVTGFTFRVNETQNPTVVLTWNPGAELDLAGYRVYRSVASGGSTPRPQRGIEHIDGMELMATLSNSMFTDATVSSGTSYVYAVSAIDVSGNESAWVTSEPLQVRALSRASEFRIE